MEDHINLKEKYDDRENHAFSLNFLAVRLFANDFTSLPSFFACSASLSKALERSFNFFEAGWSANDSATIAVEAIITERIVIAIELILYML